MIALLAQLACSIEVVPADEATARAGRPAAIEHVIAFEDALTGESLTVADVSSLGTSARVDGAPMALDGEESSPDGAMLRRVWRVPDVGDRYALVVDGGDARRYFGCAVEVPIEGPEVRRVRVALVPRARDVSVDVAITRGASVRALPPAALRALELRPESSSERDLDVHAGRCSGEQPAEGSHWCVRSLAAAPGPLRLRAAVPGWGLAALTADGTSPDRTLALTARFEGHHLPAATVRAGVAVPLVQGGGAGGLVTLDVATPDALHGRTCPLDALCARPVLHAGVGNLPYTREYVLTGPGARTQPDGATSGSLWLFEVGGGVTVAPPGTADALRITAVGSVLLGARGDERGDDGAVRSPATARMGVGFDLVAAWRFAGPFQLYAGARTQWLPAFGVLGRDFSFLGDATPSTQTASLLQFALHAGVGFEP